MGLVDLLIDWWRRRRWTRPRFARVQPFASRGDVPRRLSRRVMAILDGNPGWIIFECPCGTRHERIELMRTPLSGLPAWQLSLHSDSPTVHPSVDYVGDRQCHYWIRDGRVHWV